MNKKKKIKELKSSRGMTLLALIVTIIVLVILSAVGIHFVLENNGILNKTKEAKNETLKQAATEKINLKITNAQMETYVKEQRMPTLQELSDGLCEDDEIQYVKLQSKKIGSVSKIEVGEAESIFTKLKEYPYEFEINSSLQLESIDGIKVATNNTEGSSTNEQYNNLLNRVIELENQMERTKPVQLYSGDAKGDFTLSQSIDDFSTIEIIYRETSKANGLANSYMKVTPAELKSGVSLNAFAYIKDSSNNEFIQIFLCGLTINGTTATRSTTTYAYNIGQSTEVATVSGTGNISVVGVNGYY